MIDSPPELDCEDGEELGCLGGCFESTKLDSYASDEYYQWEVLCPVHDCDGLGADSPVCLDDPEESLEANHGVAGGAQIAVFDVGAEDDGYIWAFYAYENGLWDAAKDTGAKVHSNSWGTSVLVCETDVKSTEFDTYMFEVSVSRVIIRFCSSDARSSDLVETIRLLQCSTIILAILS